MRASNALEETCIKRNSNGDTRTADHIPTINEFDTANSMHIVDVALMMEAVSHLIADRGKGHDWTKNTEPFRSMFYEDLTATLEGKMDFEDGEWYQMHCKEERHHLDVCWPEDANLIDVIEMLCDRICASKARTGSYVPFPLDKFTLSMFAAAFRNTEQLLLDSVVLVKEED